MDIIRILVNYPRSVDNKRGYYPHFLDTIGFGHIISCLARSVCHVICSFDLVLDIVLGHITSYLASNDCPISYILLI